MPKEKDSSPNESSLLDNLLRLRAFFSRSDKKRYLILLLMMVIGAFLETVGIGVIPASLALLTHPDKYASLPILSGWGAEGAPPTTSQLIVGCILFFLVFITFKILYFGYYLNLKNRLIARHQIALSERVFSAYINAPWEFHLGKNSAELQRNVIGETIEVFNGIMNPMLQVALGVTITILIFVANLFFLPWQLFLFLIAFCVLSGLALNVFKHSLTRAGEVARDARKSSIQSVTEGLATLLEARILGKESFLVGRLTANISQFAHSDRKRDYISKLFPHILESIGILGLMLILWFLLLSGKDLVEALPVFSLVVASLVRLRQSLASVIGGLGQMHYSKYAIRNIADHLDKLKQHRQEQARSAPASPVSLTFKNQLRLEQVSYQYPQSDAPALEHLDLSIAHSDIVCLAGSSGSGKSTAINLMLGILAPASGRILVDGTPIHQNLSEWHQLIGYVPQTIHMLDDTLRRNVAFGVEDEDIDEEALNTALRLAQLEDFVQRQPDGPRTLIGEGGAKMSGGQRQRLGIARALYRKPEILILDEGTSALDNATESTLLNQLKDHAWPSTIILISHRVASIRFCSKIFVFHVDHLIQAFAKLEAEAPVRFIMIGDGDQRRALETLCGSLSLQERVRFMGFLDPEDILEWLAISDVFALASHETCVWKVRAIFSMGTSPNLRRGQVGLRIILTGSAICSLWYTSNQSAREVSCNLPCQQAHFPVSRHRFPKSDSWVRAIKVWAD